MGAKLTGAKLKRSNQPSVGLLLAVLPGGPERLVLHFRGKASAGRF